MYVRAINLILFIFFLTGFAQHTTPTPSRRPEALPGPNVTLEVHLILGSRTIDSVRAELMSYIRSPEGQAFIQSNGTSSNFWDEFGGAFRVWAAVRERMGEGGMPLLDAIKKEVASQVRIEASVWFPQDQMRRLMREVADEIAFHLAPQIAYQVRGGRIGTRLVERAIRNGSQGAAIGLVQRRYDREVSGLLLSAETQGVTSLQSTLTEFLRGTGITGQVHIVPQSERTLGWEYPATSYAVLKSATENQTRELFNIQLPLLDHLPKRRKN